MDKTNELFNDEKFQCRNKSEPKFFTRKRILTFTVIMIIILQKSVKSIQLVLNEVLGYLNVPSVTNSAFTQARRHLKHTAFIELNQKAIVEVMYQDNEYNRYKNIFRVLGIDGSKIILPNEKNIRDEFGSINFTNGKDDQIIGSKPQATASAMYDVLNGIAIDSILGHSRAYEVDLAINHLLFTRKNDLILADRNYASYRFLSELINRKVDFVIRCSSNSFNVAREMFEKKSFKSRVVILKPSDPKQIRELELPKEIKVRFVKVILDDGSIEVLVTSLIDNKLYLTEEFKEIYNMRWGVETFYSILKTRLNIENFTGKTAESVKQDFYATIYITGLESILTSDINEELKNKECKNEQKVNKAVSFNAIKNNVFDIFYKEKDTKIMLEKLESLFRSNPTTVRKGRKVERKKSSPRIIANFHKRVKKICF
ncbi:MAG: IS4 family transposase [Desulfobacterales bacterium]|nr:IS4 family transposase [Desulfobacterales bacterium]